MMNRAVLFCNGDMNAPDFHKSLIKETDYIIAVDGGGRHCKILNILPHLALGDFDSLPLDLLDYYKENQVEIKDYPADKDYIDMALALDVALDKGFSEILVLGALGGKRIDMEIGNLLLLSRYHAHIIIADENREVFSLCQDEEIDLLNATGNYLSLIPLSEKVVTKKSSGLKYQLEDLHFQFGETRSISNEIVENKATLGLSMGKALVISQKR